MTALLVAAIGALGVAIGGIVVAVINARSKNKGDLYQRLATLEQWRTVQENRYSHLWAYCRLLIDYAYKHRRDGSPDLPDMPDDLK